MTLDQFKNKWLGKKADFDGAYGGQCVDLFRFYNKEVLEIAQPKSVVGAADFWSNYDSDPNLKNNFTKIVNSPTFVPNEGDVVVWTRRAGGGFGHIAIYLRGDVNKFTSLDQNWPTLSKVTETEHNYTNVYGVLRPDIITPTPQPEEPMTDDTLIELGKPWNKMSIRDIKSNMNSMKEDLDNLIKQSGEITARYEIAQMKYEELIKIHESVKEDFIITVKTAEAKAKTWKESHDKLLAEVAGLLGTTQDKEVIKVEIEKLLEKEKKLSAISDNRPIGKDNFLQSFIKVLKVLFDKLDKGVNQNEVKN